MAYIEGFGPPEKKPRKFAPYLLTGGILVLALLLGTFYITRTSDLTPSQEQIAGIAENPDEFIGQNVDVAGQVGNILGYQAFTVENPQLDGDNILVISKQPLVPVGGSGGLEDDFLYNPNDRVSIQGKVRTFNLREIERELDRDFVDDQFTEWEGKPVIIADQIEEER